MHGVERRVKGIRALDISEPGSTGEGKERTWHFQVTYEMSTEKDAFSCFIPFNPHNNLPK